MNIKLIFLCFLFLASYFLLPASCFFSQQLVFKQAKQKASDKKDNKSTDEKKKEPINESDFQPVLLGALLEKPDSYIERKIKFRGKFSSFTTLALDYEPALRKSKDYISLAIFRTDSKIPLSELKLAYPVKEAKENQVIRELEEGDLIEIYGQVFSAALDEPWVDILSIKKIESASDKDKVAQEKEENTTLKEKANKKKK